MSRIYPLALARPRFGRRGEPSGTSERTAPIASEPSLPLSLSTHAYASMLSIHRSFVFGPAAARSFFSSLRFRGMRGQCCTRTGRGYYALEDIAIRPVVRNRADEHHIGVDNGADAGDFEWALGLEEVMRVVRQMTGVEDVSVSRSPSL